MYISWYMTLHANHKKRNYMLYELTDNTTRLTLYLRLLAHRHYVCSYLAIWSLGVFHLGEQ